MKVCILGAGAYGIALALSFYKNKNEVSIWTKVEQEKEELLTYHENKKGLPGIIIPNGINITTNFEEVKDSKLFVITIPINFLRNTLIDIKDYINNDSIFCIASKGIEKETNLFAHQILTSIISTDNISVLSGPTFAIDLANNSPSGLILATKKNNIYSLIKEKLESDNLKIVPNSDLLGTEICGSVKNVMAIAAGILNGITVTETTKALFLTEALNEISSLLQLMGGKKDTVYTLAGIGDLYLTCNSEKSRNFKLGIIIATQSQQNINNYLNNNTSEGYQALISINQIIKQKNGSSPIIELLYKIIFEKLNKDELVKLLTKN